MPNASDSLRAIIRGWFGNPTISDPEDYYWSWIDDYTSFAVLASMGFTHARGVIEPPVPSHTLTQDQFLLVKFLIDEWDYAYGPSLRSRKDPSP